MLKLKFDHQNKALQTIFTLQAFNHIDIFVVLFSFKSNPKSQNVLILYDCLLNSQKNRQTNKKKRIRF